jgi:hypothetical protein
MSASLSARSAQCNGTRGHVFRPPSGDEVGAATQRDPGLRCSHRRSAEGADETRQEQSSFVNGRFVGSDEDGGFPVNIAASDWTERAERTEQSTRLQFERAQPPS